MAAVLLFTAVFLLSADSAQAFFGLGNRAELKRSTAFIEYDIYIAAKATSTQLVLGQSATSTSLWRVLFNPFEVIVTAAIQAKSADPGIPEQLSGITMYDKVTGRPYCLEIQNGRPISTVGKCIKQISN